MTVSGTRLCNTSPSVTAGLTDTRYLLHLVPSGHVNTQALCPDIKQEMRATRAKLGFKSEYKIEDAF